MEIKPLQIVIDEDDGKYYLICRQLDNTLWMLEISSGRLYSDPRLHTTENFFKRFKLVGELTWNDQTN